MVSVKIWLCTCKVKWGGMWYSNVLCGHIYFLNNCVMRLVCVRRPLPFCLVYIPCTCAYLAIIITIVLTTCQCVQVHASVC